MTMRGGGTGVSTGLVLRSLHTSEKMIWPFAEAPLID